MSGFPASKASALPDAFFPFFFGEFFNADRVDIHGVWIDFWVLVVSVVSLNRVRVVGFLEVMASALSHWVSKWIAQVYQSLIVVGTVSIL